MYTPIYSPSGSSAREKALVGQAFSLSGSGEARAIPSKLSSATTETATRAALPLNAAAVIMFWKDIPRVEKEEKALIG
jgi:hypothetical protein